MKQPFLRVIGVAIVLFATITQLARAEVRPVCSASSIAGAYGFTLTGSYMQTLYAISGRFVGNGKGALPGSPTQPVGVTFPPMDLQHHMKLRPIVPGPPFLVLTAELNPA